MQAGKQNIQYPDNIRIISGYSNSIRYIIQDNIQLQSVSLNTDMRYLDILPRILSNWIKRPGYILAAANRINPGG
jgi:hypothetical protein